MDLLGGEPNDFVESMEKKMDRFKTRLRDFGEEWPKFLILEWMEKVTAFFEAIGLSSLVQYITFTFCDFLKIIGLPTSLAIPAGITVSIAPLKNLPQAALDAAGEVIAAGQPGSNQFPTIAKPVVEEED